MHLVAVVWPMLAIIVAQALLAGYSLQIVSTLRAYVAGESMWSKGQTGAIYYLGHYIDTGEARSFELYEAAIAAPLGDRAARLALEKQPPDLDAAREGFLAGGNHASDIDSLIWLFREFGWVSYMQSAIAAWRTADAMVLEIDTLAQAIHVHRALADDPARQQGWKLQLRNLNARIVPLANRFSDTLGEGARAIQRALLLANIALAGLLSGFTVWRMAGFLRHRRGIEDELAWRASHDALTGLPNRRLFEAQLAELLAEGQGVHALMYIDLDQFKLVNDTAGHPAGDALLLEIARVLPHVLRPNDVFARLGGDEFAVLLRDCPSVIAVQVAERLRATTQGLGFAWQGQAFNVSASVGVVGLGERAYTIEDAMRAADMACYMAKEKGRNRVQVYRSDDGELAEREGEMGWVQRLHQALEDDRFRLFAQPVGDVMGGDILGEHIEVLLRLEGEDGRMVPPSSFMPAAERFGLMPALDRWVVRNALSIMASRIGDPDFPTLKTCAINISGASLGDEDFLPYLRQTLHDSGIAPHLVCFEITETVAIANLARAQTFIESMRALGCRFALDDFGVGMSSFSYLKNLPVDFLKIDGSFIKDILVDRTDRAMVEMINHIGHVLGKRTIAECVESVEILDALRVIGVDYAQGFALARPSLFRRGLTGRQGTVRRSA